VQPTLLFSEVDNAHSAAKASEKRRTAVTVNLKIAVR
jgi:hypothetical protein